jgi:cation/acetate symporter
MYPSPVDARSWIWLVVTISFAGYLALLVEARARSAGTFYRPVRAVRPLAAGVAVASGWISAASYLSLAGAMAVSAPDGGVYAVGWIAGFALLALLVTPYLRRTGRHTVAQLLLERFDSPAAGVAAVACTALVTFTYLSAQLRGAAIVLARMAPVALPVAVAAALLVVLGYTALGRLRTITFGQVAQYAVLAAAFAVLAVALLGALTGQAVPQLAPWARLGARGAALLGEPPGLPLREAADHLGASLGLAPLARSRRGPADLAASALALAAGTAALPHIVGRFLSMPRAREARTSAAWALAFIVLFYSLVPAVALAARAALLARAAAPAAGAVPLALPGWAASGLVTAGRAGGPAALQLSAADGARLAVDPDVLVLAAPELLGLPVWVVAVAAAGALAAAVSTAAGLVISLGAAASRDLLKGILSPGLPERTELRVSRLAAAGLTVAAAWLALHPPGTVVQTVGLAFGLAAAAFFPALLAAAFWRRATGAGVLWGMIAGASFTVGYVHWFRFLHPELDVPSHWWLGISPEGIGAVGAVLGGAVLVAVSLAAPRPPVSGPGSGPGDPPAPRSP